jgi:hypothetical protein
MSCKEVGVAREKTKPHELLATWEKQKQNNKKNKQAIKQPNNCRNSENSQAEEEDLREMGIASKTTLQEHSMQTAHL